MGEVRGIQFKLLVLVAVLTAVLVYAGVAQFGSRSATADADVDWSTRNRVVSSTSGPRTVFGGDPPSAAVAQTALSETAEKNEQSQISEINGFLERWRTSILKGDPDAQAILYAPRVDYFFRQRNVSRANVRREKARMMELYPTVARYDISDIRVEWMRNNAATVTFRKEWDMRGDRRFTGAERQRLKLRKMQGDWKIISESDTKVYWTRRR